MCKPLHVGFGALATAAVIGLGWAFVNRLQDAADRSH
jgi:hypothetical protein